MTDQPSKSEDRLTPEALRTIDDGTGELSERLGEYADTWEADRKRLLELEARLHLAEAERESLAGIQELCERILEHARWIFEQTKYGHDNLNLSEPRCTVVGGPSV